MNKLLELQGFRGFFLAIGIVLLWMLAIAIAAQISPPVQGITALLFWIGAMLLSWILAKRKGYSPIIWALGTAILHALPLVILFCLKSRRAIPDVE